MRGILGKSRPQVLSLSLSPSSFPLVSSPRKMIAVVVAAAAALFALR